MKIDLIKYIMKIIAVPILFLSLILISHGADDHISFINVIGIVLLFISGIVIINDVDKKE
uniref:Uncharacterized protein n=1 Tax=CrAss-like virus sp. ctXt06 TaxID=2825837 RepID=A0A8S5V6M9_9CAUD|nr:MAG TPA: hypothetical protein [CrAss-like virus sp. ctXt06]